MYLDEFDHRDFLWDRAVTLREASRVLGLPENLIRQLAYLDDDYGEDHLVDDGYGPEVVFVPSSSFPVEIPDWRPVTVRKTGEHTMVFEGREIDRLRDALARLRAIPGAGDRFRETLAEWWGLQAIDGRLVSAAFCAKMLDVTRHRVLQMIENGVLKGEQRPRPGATRPDWFVALESLEHEMARRVGAE